MDQGEQPKKRRCRPRRAPQVIIAHVPMPVPMPHAPRDCAEASAGEDSYLDSIDAEEAKKLRRLEERVMGATSSVPLRYQILSTHLPDAIKSQMLQKMGGCDPKYEAWTKKTLALPLGKYDSSTKSEPAAIPQLLRQCKATMDAEICGNGEAKNEILRVMGQYYTSGVSGACAIGLEGPPGVGKTTFAKAALSKSMSRPFCFISLGGASDGSMLLGHSYTYEGSMCGRIAEELLRVQCMDPVFYFDELDKIAQTARGDEITNALIHLVDPAQSSDFRDRYFAGIELDLSRAMFVFSFNQRENVSPILLDRLKIIHCSSPTVLEKQEIATKHLIPRALVAIGDESLIRFPGETVMSLVASGAESGVRDLNRSIQHIVNTINVCAHGGAAILGMEEAGFEQRPVVCTPHMCKQLVSKKDDLKDREERLSTMYT